MAGTETAALTQITFGDTAVEITTQSEAQLSAGLVCGQIDIGQLNYLFKTLFDRQEIFRVNLNTINDFFNDPASSDGLVAIKDVAGNITHYAIAPSA